MIAALGYFLGYRRILQDSVVADISELVIKVFAPCFIFANVAGAGGLAGVSGWRGAILVAAGPALLGLGYVCSAQLAKLCGVDRSYRTAVVAASTFQNQLYLPLAVGVSVVASIAPALAGPGTTSAAAVTAFVLAMSVFAIGYGPFFWGIGLSWITSERDGGIDLKGPGGWRKLVPPPVLGLIVGYAVVLTPLASLLVPLHAPLHFAFAAAGDVGSVTVPVANMMLGAMLARSGPGSREPFKNLAIVVATRFLITPGICLLIVYATRHIWHGVPGAGIVAFAIFLESMSPPATNLAVMSKRSPDTVAGFENRTAEAIPRILLVCYTLAMLAMPLWLLLFVHLAGRW
jgi:predicted permease